jgi:hypothetical protein
MTNLKKRIARRIASWLIDPTDVPEAKVVREKPDGSVSVRHTLRSVRAARRYQLSLALRRNPYGRRALDWLIRAGSQ